MALNKNSARALVVVALCLLLVTGCGPTSTVEGRAVSMRFDPYRVAGLAAVDGPSGPRGALGSATGRVQNTDDGEIDRLALAAIEDIEDFWSTHYSDSLKGSFSPVGTLVSIDPSNSSSPTVCGAKASMFEFNAAYCQKSDIMVWDRANLLPVAKKFFGDMSVNGVLAHEYGHAVQWQAQLVDADTTTFVAEQQADCLAGSYLRWVAQGDSPNFTLNTTDGLDRVVAGAIAMRDPATALGQFVSSDDAHGSALDRVSALQKGFDIGVVGCAAINADEIRERQADLPESLFKPAASDTDISKDTVSTLMDVLGKIFTPTSAPTLTTDQSGCTLSNGVAAAYCPDTNTLAVDIDKLKAVGTPADENDQVLLQGDNTALSMVTSRYMLALQQERGVSLESATAAMRTACLTGVAQAKMSTESNLALTLGAGDLDEAVSGLLTNGMVASDVHGETVPSGFTRISAYRAGLGGDADSCYRRFA